MENNEKNPWKTLSTKQVYSNPWIDVTHRDVINPSGNNGIYGLVHFKNIAVGVIPLDQDYNTWIVGQYRYTINEYSWEIPEGGCPEDQDPLEAAKRELKEETGIIAQDWKAFQTLHTSNSVCDEKAILYIARDLSFTPPSPEETELLQVKKLQFEDLVKLVMIGKISDAMSVSAILKANYMIQNNII